MAEGGQVVSVKAETTVASHPPTQTTRGGERYFKKVLVTGVEPVTLGLLDPRSNRLSYTSLQLEDSISLTFLRKSTPQPLWSPSSPVRRTGPKSPCGARSLRKLEGQWPLRLKGKGGRVGRDLGGGPRLAHRSRAVAMWQCGGKSSKRTSRGARLRA